MVPSPPGPDDGRKVRSRDAGATGAARGSTLRGVTLVLWAYIPIVEVAMRLNDEYPTPSQAEGERLEEDMNPAEERHPATTRTQPSQAEGERRTEDDDR